MSQAIKDFKHLPQLPVVEALPELLNQLENHTNVVLEAPPGAGKTTLVPLALLGATWRGTGKILVLEPRRLATRAAAARMADLLGEELGKTVGYWIRMEHVVSEETKVEVVTEGILTRMLQEDPALEGVAAVIFDEFHERSLQADLGLALALDTQAVLRPDLRIIVMSATLDASALGNWLKAPIVSSKGRMYPVVTHYLTPAEAAAAGTQPRERIRNLVPSTILKALKEQPEGDILVFLPGMAEIRIVADKISDKLASSIDLHILHGELSLAKQKEAIKPAAPGRRKVVLATSIAETSLTIEGVKIVIDGGYARVPLFVPKSGLTTLQTVTVSKAAADQRRGRAGRLAPGTCYRLWTKADQLQLADRQAPEILEADLSGLALELSLWGVQDPTSLNWIDSPPQASLTIAYDLLKRLETIDAVRKPTQHGKAVAALGLHPRLAHMIIRGKELQHGTTACALAALLSEKDILKRLDAGLTTIQPDLELRLEIVAGQHRQVPGYVVEEHVLRRVREQAKYLRQRVRVNENKIDASVAGKLTALAYPDRIAQLETTGKVRLVTGHRAQLPTELFSEATFYAIAHLDLGKYPRVLLASQLDRNELLAVFDSQREEYETVLWDEKSKRVKASKITKLGALILKEQVISNPDPSQIQDALLKAIKEKGLSALPWSKEAENVKLRLQFLHTIAPATWPIFSDTALEATMEEWLTPHLFGLNSLEQVNRLDLKEILLSSLSWEQRQEMEKLAPSHIQVASGSRIAIDYSNPESPVLPVRLQEVFGMFDTPKIGGGKIPLLMHLLSPASRPVQVTKDLKSFWASGYFEVRKDLRGRYPKHYWPEDPLTAEPTRGVKKKKPQ